MIDRSLIDPAKLLNVLLDTSCGNRNHWLRLVEIVPDYVPPFPRDDTRPTIQVRCLTNITEPLPGPGVCTSRYSYLRWSGAGNVTWNHGGYFWDMYGDAFYTVEHAFLAALHAPVPPGLLERIAWLPEGDLDKVKPREWCEGCRQPKTPYSCVGCRVFPEDE